MTRRTLPLLLALVLGAILAPAAFAQEEASVEDLVRDGTFYLQAGSCELAQYYFQEALKLEANNPQALVGNGRSLVCRNNYDRAIESFRQAIEADPQRSDAYVHLALAYQDQYLSDPNRFPNRLNEALRTLELAEQYAPEDPRVLNAKGVILFQMGSLQAAQTSLERAIQTSGQSQYSLGPAERSVIHVNLGKTYRDLGNLEQARTAFRRAVMLDPVNSSAHNNLGNVHYRLGDCSEAEYELAQAAALDPQSLSAVSQLAIALFECGSIEASIVHFERALTLSGAIFNPPLYTYLARAYLEQGRYDDAAYRAQQGAQLPPPSAEAFYYLGQVYEARGADGDLAGAREAYQRAVELNPDYAPAQEALAALQ